MHILHFKINPIINNVMQINPYNGAIVLDQNTQQ